MSNFCDFIQVYVFTTNHHLKNNRRVSPCITIYEYADPCTTIFHGASLCGLNIQSIFSFVLSVHIDI